MQKTHKSCLIKLLNRSNIVFRKNIFDNHTGRPRKNPVQIFSPSDYCITTDIKNRGLVLLYILNQIFSGHAVFCKVLAYYVYESSENFNDWMQRYGQKPQKCPKNGGFPPFATPQDFFSKIGLCHFCTLVVP